VTTADLLAGAAAASSGTPGVTVEEVTQKASGDTLEARSVSATIRTVDDLLARIGADMARYEVAASEATCWEGLTADRLSGHPIVTTLHRVFVRLKPRAGPGVKECVEAMIEAAAGSIRRPAVKASRARPSDCYGVLVVADVHFGKYAWRPGTGHDPYDLAAAASRVEDASTRLLEALAGYRPGQVLVAFVGDLFHADNPALTTTGGTALAGSTDGRLQKMIGMGCDSLLGIVDAAASVAPVDSLVVNGNHDETLTWAFQRILAERFRTDGRVNVSQDFTGRQYRPLGRNLLGFAHGHRAKKKLPQLMAIERPADWSQCPYREWHTGHLHHQAAEWSRPIETIDGVLVRIAPSLSSPDDYHSTHGWVGQREAMEAFVYDAAGGLAAMHVAGPRMAASA